MRTGWRGALGIAFSAAFLFLAFRGVDFSKVIEGLRHVDVALMLAAVVAATAIFPLRARRWRTILDPIAPNVTFGKLWRATTIGMMVNNVVPARAGELARAYALAHEERRVTFSSAFASLVVDRIFDALIILVLMFGAMLDPRFPAGTFRSTAGVAITGIAGMVAAAIVLYLIVFFPDRTVTMFELFARRVAPRFEQLGKE